MMNTSNALVLVFCSMVVSSPAAAAGARVPDVVVKTDGTRVEGRVKEEKGKDFVTVRKKSGSVRVKRDDIEIIITRATPLHDKFRYDPTPKYLLQLAARAGMVFTLEKADELLKQVSHAGSKTEAADVLLKALKLRPEDTKAVVDKNVEEFKDKFGAKAQVLESKHYVVLSNLDAAMTRSVAIRMDGIFREFENRLVFLEKITDRFVVKVYKDRNDYLASGAPGFSAAYFSSHQRELVGYRTPKFDDMFRPLYHEGMHQFLHFYVPNPPTWFDEGLAKYFETARPMPGRRKAGVPNYHVGSKNVNESRYLRYHLRRGKLIPLQTLIRLSKQQFYTQNTQLNYAQAWAFTHFLLESGNKTLKQFWIDYFFELRDGATGKEANERIFGKVNMDQLEKMFLAYVRRL